MHLAYLLFDATDDDAGACSFDAMASVLTDRMPAVLDEIGAVLAWARRHFGPPSVAADEGEWAFELQATDGNDAALAVTWDGDRPCMPVQPAAGRVTLAFTVSGSAAFAQAFRDAFPDAD